MIGGIVQFVLGVGWVVYNVGYVGGNTGVTYGRRVAKTRLVSAWTVPGLVDTGEVCGSR